MNERKILSDIADSFIEKHDMDKKDAELFIKNMFDLIEESLSTDKYVKIKGLGTFKLTEVDARESVDVNTGERIEIQGHTKVSFAPDTAMKELINKPFSHFETVVLNDSVKLEDVLTEEDVEEDTSEVVDSPVVEEAVNSEQEVDVVEPELPDMESQAETIIEPETVISTEPEPVPVVVDEESVPSPSAEENEAIKEEETEESVEIPLTVETQEEVMEEVQPESVASAEVRVPQEKEKRTIRVLWGVIIVLILVILCGCYWMFMHADTSSEDIPVSPVQEELGIVESVSEEVKEDTLVAEVKSEVVMQEKPESTVVALPVSNKNKVASLADTLEYRIVGTKTTYTLQSGESIVKASVKFFGSKMFWPYIVKHNQDVIKNPDDIPVGTEIKIPDLALKD